ncbi:hypothetical protein AKJ16_DCAP23747 [Drosera capensis]
MLSVRVPTMIAKLTPIQMLKLQTRLLRRNSRCCNKRMDWCRKAMLLCMWEKRIKRRATSGSRTCSSMPKKSSSSVIPLVGSRFHAKRRRAFASEIIRERLSLGLVDLEEKAKRAS